MSRSREKAGQETPERGEKRWSRRKEDRPAEILSAAIACFAQRGFAATRIDDVALRAGVTKGTVYLYFSTKEELFKAVVRQSLLPLLEQFIGHVDQTHDDPAEQIRRGVLLFAKHVLPSPLRVIPKLIISEAQNFPDLARFYLDEVVSRGRSVLAGTIRRGVQQGIFREVNPDHVFYSIIGPMLLALLYQQSLGLYDSHPLDAQAMIQTHLDIVFRGLAPAGEQATAVLKKPRSRAGPQPARASRSRRKGSLV
jgi:AcrR family transcriptional regulator